MLEYSIHSRASVDYAFQYCSSLMSIALPAGLTSLGPGAFYGCSSMASIDLPAGGRVW
jgi:hypothetical protein